MDVRGAAFFYTLATLMVTFAGFSALLLILRQSAGGKLSSLDRFLTRTVVGNLFVLTAGALLPPLLALYDMPELRIWTASALAFGLPYLAILMTFSQRRIRATGRRPPAIITVVFIGLGSATIIATIASIVAGFPHPAAVYATALLVNLLTLAFSFVVALEVILGQEGVSGP